MSKSKPTQQQIERVLQNPSIYRFRMRDVPVSQYASAITVLMNDPDYKAIEEKRNKLIASSMQLSTGTSEMRSLVQQIEKQNRKIGDVLFSLFVQANAYAPGCTETIPFKTMLKYYADHSSPDVKEKIDQLTNNLVKIGFVADYIESVVTDIRSLMSEIFGPIYFFEQFDAVSETLKHLSVFLGFTRSKKFDSPENNIYCEYSDSINAYLDKRCGTYVEKLNNIFPPSKFFTEQDMIEGLRQFFDDDSFDSHFIAHIGLHGSYIDAAILLPALNAEQTVKLTRIVKSIDNAKDLQVADNQKVSFTVTDAIMSHYVKPKSKSKTP